MKLFLTQILLFLLVLTATIVVLSNYDNADKDYNTNHNIIALQKKSDFDSLDILFIGSSYSYSGIQPTLFDSINIKSFNLAIANAGPQFYELIVNDYLKSISKKPKIIVIAVSPVTFSIFADNFITYPIHRYLENPVSNLEISMKYDLYSQIIPLYTKSLKKINSNLFKEKEKIDYLPFYQNKGFIPGDAVVNEKMITQDRPLYLLFKKWQLNRDKVDLLKKVVMNIEKGGIKVVYLELPTNLLTSYLNHNFLMTYGSVLKELAAKNIMIRIDKDKFSQKNYRNIDHLNASGATIATKQLIHQIVNNDTIIKILRR